MRHYIYCENFYRVRYRDPKHRRWVSKWTETHVAAELCRAGIQQRFASRKIDVEIERFELNLGKSAVVQFLNEHAGE